MSQTVDYNFLPKHTFNELAQTHDLHCISIYLPTFRAGEEVDSGKSQIILKNCIKEVRKNLEDDELGPSEIKRILRPVENLLDDTDFWHHQSDGLAIFRSKNTFSCYPLPLSFETITYQSDHFYLQPIIPLFNDDGKFFILRLEQRNVELFECFRHQLSKIPLNSAVPEQMKEVVGYDYEDDDLQFRSQGPDSEAMYHGHREGKDDREAEFIQFIHAVDTGLNKILRDERAPLILASNEEHFGLFRKISNYPRIFKQHIQPESHMDDPMTLHEMAWQVVSGYFEKTRSDKVDYFMNLSGSDRISIKLEKIIPAAVDGRVETLFIKKSQALYGLYDEENRTVIIDQEKNSRNASLTNLAALKTLLQGGNVLLMESKEMPVRGTLMNAIYRY